MGDESLARSTDPSPLRLMDGAEAADINELVERAQLAERHGRRDEARALYERALYRLTSPAQAPLASALLRWAGRTYQMDADLEAALDCLDAALAVAEACGDEASVGHAINLQAIARWQQGRFDEAERLYLEARGSAVRSGDVKLAAMTAQNLGVIANIRGDLEQARRHYEMSLADYRALGHAQDACGTLSNLGMLYTQLQQWDAADRAYEEALHMCTALGDLSTSTLVHANIGEMWIARGDLGRAREACDRAMELSNQTGDALALGEVHKIYGIIARESGEVAAAEEHFASAEQAAEGRQNLLLLAEIAREKAELFGRQDRNRDMLQCLNRAHRLFAQLHARRDVADVDRRTRRLEEKFLEVAQRWGDSIESKDHYTQGHCERVADVACAIAAKSGMDARSLFWFRIGALLHDVGKLIIPAEVLNKPGRLTDEEWALVKRHPMAGVEMLADIEFPWDVLPMVESHHERWDGGGYPHGLKGEEIPRTARILCIADVYDALTSERSYRRALSHAEAMEIMRRDVGVQFDPTLFQHFEEAIRAGPLTPAEPPPAEAAPDTRPYTRGAWSGEIDDLTGVLLRRAFLDAAGRRLDRQLAAELPASLLVIDVDHFKLVNDTFGHLQGDAVLCSVAEVLRRNVRSDDLVGRYAGDEFVILLPGRRAEQAAEIAERLRAAVHSQACPLRDAGERSGEGITVTLSIGVATAPQHGVSTEALFAAADRALYAAKRQGRNAVASATATDADIPQLKLDRFVGRGHEMRRLVRLLERSVGGEPQVVTIAGEAGVGKSTLLRQLVPEVRLRAGALVTGRCMEADVKPPYGPWADVIRAIRTLGLVPTRSWRELVRLVPEVGDGVLPHEAPVGSKYILFEEIAAYLRSAAASCPLVIVLDDMQWADSATWDTLEHLLPHLEKDRLLICLTIRSEDCTAAVIERRRRLSRDERFQELALQRLTRDELRQWMEMALGRQDVGEDLLSFLYQQTEGNPLLVVQVLRTLMEEGALWHTGERWAWRPVSEFELPVAVTDLVARRLERLSPKARNILSGAAVIGRVFELDLAIAAGVGTEDELLDAVDEGIAAWVLERAGGAAGQDAHNEDRFAFAHTLLREAMRRSANPRRIKRMHERVAAALEARSPTAVAEIAAHYDRANNGAKAYDYGLLAGSGATAVYAHDEASAFFAMALRHAVTREQRADAGLRLAQVAEDAGRYADAESLCGQVLELIAADSNSARTLPIRRMRERVRSRLGRLPQDTLVACHALLVEAASAGLEDEQAALLLMISQAHSRLGDRSGAELLARECVRMAEQTSDTRLLADALTRLGTTLLEVEPDEAIGFYDRALVLFTRIGDRYGQIRCHINTGIACDRIGRTESAERSYRLALELGRSSHAPDLAGLASINLGVLHLRGGSYGDARERLDEALRLFTAVGNEPHRLATMYNMAHLARERGDAAAAVELYAATAELARKIGQIDVEIGALAGTGLAGLTLGRPELVDTSLHEVAARLSSRGDWWFQGRELAEALDVRVALRTIGARAETRFREALALAERNDRYAAAWLLAECAGPLAAVGATAVRETVEEYAREVEALGYASLSARFAAFRAACR